MKLKLLLTTVSAAAGLLLSAPLVRADATLTLISGGTTTSVSAVSGVAMFNGAVGSWTLNVDTGLGAGAIGPQPKLDLSFDAIGSAGAMPLYIIWSQNNNSPAGGMEGTIGGTLDSGLSVTFDNYYNTNNAVVATLAGLGTFLAGPPTFTGSPFSASSSGTIVASGQYDLSEVIEVQDGVSGGQTSGDANLHVLPDGGLTLAMLGCGLVGLAGLRARFGSKIA